MPESRSPTRALAIVALAIGALGSIALMLRVGYRNPSWLLLLMFVAWVSVPFAALAWAMRAFASRAPALHRTIDLSAIVVAVASLTVYGRVVFGPPRPKPAAPFLLTPPILLALAFAAVALATRSSRK
jgi:hypothetical protein